MIPVLTQQRAIFDRLKIPYEILDQSEMRKRFPMMSSDDVTVGFLESLRQQF